MKTASDAGVKVLLNGQGGDELLAGYNPFPHLFGIYLRTGRLFKAGRLVRSLQASQHTGLGQMVYQQFLGTLSYWYRRITCQPDFYRKRTIVNFARDSALTSSAAKILFSLRSELSRPRPNSLHAMLADWIKYGLVNLLRFEDRNSMRWSLESRVPYLDLEVITLIWQVDADLLVRDGWTKWLHRKTFEGDLPHHVVWRREKVGFQAPDQWLLAPYVNRWIDLVKSELSEFIEVPSALSLIAALPDCPMALKTVRQIWRWINLGLWLNTIPRRVAQYRALAFSYR